MEFLRGKKTYIAAVLIGLGALGAFLSDQIDGPTLFQRLSEAAALAGLRHAVE